MSVQLKAILKGASAATKVRDVLLIATRIDWLKASWAKLELEDS